MSGKRGVDIAMPAVVQHSQCHDIAQHWERVKGQCAFVDLAGVDPVRSANDGRAIEDSDASLRLRAQCLIARFLSSVDLAHALKNSCVEIRRMYLIEADACVYDVRTIWIDFSSMKCVMFAHAFCCAM
jgi:hypothetical protein